MPETSNDINPGMAPGQQPGFEEDPQPTTTTTAPVTTATATVVMQYLTLPLQIGTSTSVGQGVSRIDWKQYQTSPLLALCLLDANGVPVNLTGATVRLRLAPLYGGGAVISEAMTLLYAQGGQVGYAFTAPDVALSGTYRLEVEAVLASGAFMYFPSDGSIIFQIHPSLGGP